MDLPPTGKSRGRRSQEPLLAQMPREQGKLITKEAPARLSYCQLESPTFYAAQTASTNWAQPDRGIYKKATHSCAASSIATTLTHAAQSPANFFRAGLSAPMCGSLGSYSATSKKSYRGAASLLSKLPKAAGASDTGRARVGALSYIQAIVPSSSAVASDAADTRFPRTATTATLPRTAMGRDCRSRTDPSGLNRSRKHSRKFCCRTSNGCTDMCCNSCHCDNHSFNYTSVCGCGDMCWRPWFSPREAGSHSLVGTSRLPSSLDEAHQIAETVGRHAPGNINAKATRAALELRLLDARGHAATKSFFPKPQKHRRASRSKSWPAQQLHALGSRHEDPGFDRCHLSAIPSHKGRGNPEVLLPQKDCEEASARMVPLPASSSANLSCRNTTSITRGTPEKPLSFPCPDICSTCGGPGLINNRLLASQNSGTLPCLKRLCDPSSVPSCLISLSVAAAAAETLTAILEHISHHIVVQPLLFVLLPPVIHLLLQILPPLVQLHSSSSQRKLTSGIRLLSKDVLALLSSKSAELLVSLQLDLVYSSCSRNKQVRRARPTHAYLKQHSHHQARLRLRRSTHISAASKRPCNQMNQPYEKAPDDNERQQENPPSREEKRGKAQLINPRGTKPRKQNSHSPNSMSCRHSVGRKRTHSLREIFCRDMPVKSDFRVRRSCSTLPWCGTCCDSTGGCRVQHAVPSRALQNIILRHRSSRELSTTDRHEGSRSKGAYYNSPLSVLMSGSGSSGDYNRRTSQSSTCEGKASGSLFDNVLTRSQLKGLRAGLRRLLRIAKGADCVHLGSVKQLIGEQPKVCWSMLPGRRAAAAPCTPTMNDAIPFAAVFSRCLASKNSACKACRKAVMEAPSEDVFDNGTFCNATSPCVDASDTPAFAVADEATSCCVTHNSGGGTACLSGLCSTEGTGGSFARNNRERSTWLQSSGGCLEQLTSQPLPDNKVLKRFSQEQWPARQVQPARSVPNVQAPVLLLLQKGALLPLHPHKLLAFARGERRRKRHSQQTATSLQGSSPTVPAGAVTHIRNRGRYQTGKIRPVAAEKHSFEGHLRQRRDLKDSLREGLFQRLIPVNIPNTSPGLFESKATSHNCRCLGTRSSKPVNKIRSQARCHGHATNKKRAKPSVAVCSPPTGSTAELLSYTAESDPVAGTSVANEDWLGVEGATPAAVCNSRTLGVKVLTSALATPCHSPPAVDGEQATGCFVSRSATAVSADVRLRAEARHGVSPQLTPSTFCTPMLCSLCECCRRSGVPQGALETEQKRKGHPVRLTEQRRNPEPRRIWGRARKQRSCITFPQNSNEVALRRSQSLIAAGTTVDGLLSHTEEAVRSTVQTVPKYNLHSPSRGTAFSAGEAYRGEVSKKSSLAAAISVAPVASLTATAKPPWSVAAFTINAQKAARALKQAYLGADSPGICSLATQQNKSHHAHLKESKFPSIEGKSTEKSHTLQGISSDMEVTDNGFHQVRLPERSSCADELLESAENAARDSGAERVAVGHSTSVDCYKSVPGMLSEPFPLVHLATIHCADPQPSPADISRSAFVLLRSGSVYRPLSEPPPSKLKPKQLCSRRCKTLTPSTQAFLTTGNRRTATIDTSGRLLYRDSLAKSQCHKSVASAPENFYDGQSTTLKPVAAQTPSFAKSIFSSGGDTYAPTASPSVQSCALLREETKQWKVLCRRTPHNLQEWKSVTREAVFPTAARPVAPSNVCPLHRSGNESMTCFKRKLQVATDAEATVMGRTKQKETSLWLLAPHLHHRTRTHGEVPGLPLLLQNCSRKEDVSVLYLADGTSKERRVTTPADRLCESLSSADLNKTHRGYNPPSQDCRADATHQVWPKSSRAESPPLFFSRPAEVISLLHNEEPTIRSRAKTVLESKKRTEHHVVGIGLSNDSYLVAPSSGTPGHHKVQDPRSHSKGIADGGSRRLRMLAGSRSVVSTSPSDRKKKSTVEDLVCVQAQALLHRGHSVCQELRRLTHVLQMPCRCEKRFSQQSFVTAVPQCVGQSRRVRTRSCEELTTAIKSASTTWLSSENVASVAVVTLREHALSSMGARSHPGPARCSTRATGVLGTSASVVPPASKAEIFLESGSARGIKRSTPQLAAGDVNGKASVAKGNSVNYATHRHDAISDKTIGEKTVVCSEVYTPQSTENAHKIGTALRAVPCAKLQSTIATSGDRCPLQPVACHGTARFKQVCESEIAADRIFYQRGGMRVHCCVDRRLLFQQRTICCRALQTAARELAELISQHCTKLFSLSRSKQTNGTETFNPVACTQHTATFRRLLSILLQFISLINSFARTGSNRFCCGKGGKFLPKPTRPGKALQWQQQRQRKDILQRWLLLGPPRSSNSRSKIGQHRKRQKLQTIRLVGTFARTKRSVTCCVNSGLARALCEILLRPWGKILDALCRCAAAATIRPCPYIAGEVDTSRSHHKVDVLQRTPESDKLSICSANSASKDPIENNAACKGKASADALLRAVEGVCGSGHRGGCSKEMMFIPGGKEEVGHLEGLMISNAGMGAPRYPSVISLANEEFCFERGLCVVPGMRERRHNLSRTTADRRLSEKRAKQGETVWSTNEKASAIRGVIFKTQARQLAAACPAGGYSALQFQALPLADGNSAVHTKFDGCRSEKIVTAGSAAARNLSASAGRLPAQRLIPTNKIDNYVLGVPAPDAAVEPAVDHCLNIANCIVEVLSDPRMVRAFTQTIPEVFRLHRYTHLFPYLLQLVLCGALTTHSSSGAGISVSSCNALPFASGLAMSFSASPGNPMSCNFLKRDRFCGALFEGSTPTDRKEVGEQALAGQFLLFPAVKQSAASTRTLQDLSTSRIAAYGSEAELRFLPCDVSRPFPDKHRSLCPLHMPRSAGASFFQRGALRQLPARRNAESAVFNHSFQEFPYSSVYSSALQTFSLSSQKSPTLELLDSRASGRGLLLFYTAVDFSMCPWTACLSSPIDMACCAPFNSSVSSEESGEHNFVHLSAMAGAKHAAIALKIFGFSGDPATPVNSEFASGDLLTLLPLVCLSSNADFDLASLPVAPYRPYASSSRTSLRRTLSSTTTSQNGAFPGKPFGKSHISSVVPHAAILTKRRFSSDISANCASESTLTERVQTLHTCLLLKMFKIKEWVTVVEKQHQHRLVDSESRCMLLARVTADLLLHTLQRCRAPKKCTVPYEELQRASTALLLTSRLPQAASRAERVLSGRESRQAGNHPALQGGHTMASPLTSARLAAISVIFAPNRHGERFGEAPYQLCLCMLVSCLSSPVLVCGSQAVCLGNCMQAHEFLPRKTALSSTLWGESRLARPDLNGSLPTMLASDASNSGAVQAPGANVSRDQQVLPVKKYKHSLKSNTPCMRQAKRGSHTHANNNKKRVTRDFQMTFLSEVKCRNLKTCCGHTYPLQCSGGAASRRMSLRLLLDCLVRVPELLSALLPVVLFCMPVHLFHPQFPRSLLRLLYLHVKQGKCLSNGVAFNTSPFKADSRNSSAIPRRSRATATGEVSLPGDTDYIPTASHALVEQAFSPSCASHAAASSADAIRVMPAGQITASETVERVASAERTDRAQQQLTKSRHLILGATAEKWWMLRCVAIKQYYACLAEKTSLLHYEPLLRSERVYQNSCVLLQGAALSVLRRLAALLPSLAFTYSCLTACAYRGQDTYKRASLKLFSWNPVGQPLPAATRLLDKRRAAKRLTQIKILCALFRLLMLRAVEVALDNSSEACHSQRGENTVSGECDDAVQPPVRSRHQYAVKGRRSGRRRRRGGGENAEKLSKKEDFLQGKQPFLGVLESTPLEAENSVETSELNFSVTLAETTEEPRRPWYTSAGKAPASLVLAPKQAVTGKRTTSKQTPETRARQKSYSVAFEKSSHNSSSELDIGGCVEADREGTSPVSPQRETEHKQLESTLGELLVCAALSAAAECTFFSRCARSQRYSSAVSSLKVGYTHAIASFRKVARMQRGVSAIAAPSSESSCANSFKAALKVSLGNSTFFNCAKASGTRGNALKRLAGQTGRRLSVRAQASSGDTQRKVPCSTRVRTSRKLRRLNGRTKMLINGNTYVQQQLIKAFGNCIARGVAKSLAKRAAHFVGTARQHYAHERSASETAVRLIEKAPASRQRKEQQKHGEDRLLACDISACVDRLQQDDALIVSRQRPRQCRSKTKRRVARAWIPVSNSPRGCKDQQLARVSGRTKGNVHIKHRTFLVGWHLLKTCIQAVKILPSKEQQSSVVCKAIRRLSEYRSAVPNSACASDGLRSLAGFSCNQKKTDRKISDTCSTVLLPCVLSREDDSTLTSAAETPYLTRGASTLMSLASTGKNTSCGTAKATRMRGVGTTVTTAWCTGSAVDADVHPHAPEVMDAKSASTTTELLPVAVCASDNLLIPKTKELTLFPKIATDAEDERIPKRSRISGVRRATALAGRQRTTCLLSGDFSSTDKRRAPAGVQRWNANAVGIEARNAYRDTTSRTQGSGQGFNIVGVQVAETTRCAIMDNVDGLENRRSWLQCKPLLGLYPKPVTKKERHLFCLTSVLNEHLRQQAKHVYFDQAWVFEERCCAAGALALHGRPFGQCLLPLKFISGAEWQKRQLPTTEVASGGLLAGARVFQGQQHSHRQLGANGHMPGEEETHTEKMRKALLPQRPRLHTDRRLIDGPVGQNQSADDNSLQHRGLPLSLIASAPYGLRKKQLKAFESYPCMIPAATGPSNVASDSRGRSVTNRVSCTDEAACGAHQPGKIVYRKALREKAHQNECEYELAAKSKTEIDSVSFSFSCWPQKTDYSSVANIIQQQRWLAWRFNDKSAKRQRVGRCFSGKAQAEDACYPRGMRRKRSSACRDQAGDSAVKYASISRLLSRPRILKQSPFSIPQKFAGAPPATTALLIHAISRPAVVSPRTKVAAARSFIHSPEPATHTLGHLPLIQCANNSIATDTVHLFQPCGGKRHTQEVGVYKPTFERAGTMVYLISSEGSINNGNPDNLSTSSAVTRQTPTRAANIGANDSFLKETSALDATFVPGESPVTDSFREQYTDPSPSSLFYLSSSSFSLCDTPRDPSKFTLTEIAHKKKVPMKTVPSHAAKADVYDRNHLSRARLALLTTTPRAEVKPNLQRRYTRSKHMHAYPQRTSLCVRLRKKLQHSRSKLDKQKSVAKVAARLRACLHFFHALARHTGYRISDKKTHEDVRPSAALRRHEGEQVMMLHPSTPARRRKSMSKASSLFIPHLQRNPSAIMLLESVHLYVERLLPLLLTNTKYTHRCNEGYKLEGEVLAKRCVQPEARRQVETCIVKKATQLDERQRLPAANGGSRPVRVVGDNLLGRRTWVRLKRHGNAFAPRSIEKTSARMRNYVGPLLQHDLMALTSTHLGKSLRPAHALSDEMQGGTQIADQCRVKAAYDRADKRFSCYGTNLIRVPGSTLPSLVRLGFKGSVTGTFLDSLDCKHERNIIAGGPTARRQVRTPPMAGVCVSTRASGLVVRGARECSSVLAGRHCRPVRTVKHSRLRVAYSLRPFKKSKSEASKSIPRRLFSEVAGVDLVQHPYDTVLLFEPTGFILYATEPKGHLVRNNPHDPCVRVNVAQLILPARALQKYLHSAENIRLPWEVAAKDAHTQASFSRKAGKSKFPGSAELVQRQPLMTKPLTRLPLRFCNDIAEVQCRFKSAAPRASSAACKAEVYGACAVVTTCLAIPRPCTCPHQKRLQHSIYLSRISLSDQTSTSGIPYRFDGYMSRKKALLHRYSRNSRSVLAYRAIHKIIIGKGDLLAVPRAGEGDTPCMIYLQRLFVPSHARRPVLQRFRTLTSGRGKTGLQDRFQCLLWGGEDPGSRQESKQKHAFEARKRDFRRSEESPIEERLIANQRRQLEKRVLNSAHLSLEVHFSSAPVGNLPIAHIPVSLRRQAPHKENTKKHSSKRMYIHRFYALGTQVPLRAAAILSLWGPATQRIATCCRLQLPKPDPEEHVTNTSGNATAPIFEKLVLLRCSEAMCSPSSCQGSVCELDDAGEKHLPLDDAKAQQLWTPDIDLRGRHAAAWQKSAEIIPEAINSANASLRADCAGLEAGAVTSHMTDTLDFHQCIRGGHLQPRRQKGILIKGSLSRQYAVRSTLSKKPNDRQMNITVYGVHSPIRTTLRLRLNGHHTRSRGSVPPAKRSFSMKHEGDGKNAVLSCGTDSTTMVAAASYECATRQLCLGQTAAVTRSASREAADTVRHTLSACVEECAVWIPTSAAAQTMFGDYVLSDSPSSCEEADREFDTELEYGRSLFDVHASDSQTTESCRFPNYCTWTEIESAVHPWQDDEDAEEFPYSKCRQGSGDKPGDVLRGITQKVHVCKICCGDAPPPPASPPPIRCVSTLFDSQPCQQARSVRPISPPQQPAK